MLRIFETLSAAIQNNQAAVLCTIVTGHGSAPRGAGAKMVVFQDGSTLGTVGGGAVELHCIEIAKQVLASGESVIQPFCLAPNEVNDIGMVCGGNVTICFRRFDQKDAPFLARALAVLRGEENAWLIFRMKDGTETELGLFDEEKGLQFLCDVPDALLKKNLHAGAELISGDPSYYFEPISTRGKVYIFGGGHVGAALAPLLSGLGFRVCVYDNRPEFAVPENFPGAYRVILGDFNDIFSKVSVTKDDYAVIMTPGHQADLAVLKQVLQTEAQYIGCIGSKKKIAVTEDALLQAGYTKEQLTRIVSPIGLSILAETPAEIAVSIAGQLIELRARQHGSKKEGWK
ncbi:MAG: xanthine dehydrogenase accessory protein XdhC [Clostridia bacterium]|nr:xanthine dehydrogenase accessory protein XdhC [Clostridia bacterium]